MTSQTASALETILAAKRAEVAREKEAVSLDAVMNRATHQEDARSLSVALAEPGLSVIAEVKRRSPSAGSIDETADPAALARAYEAGGAAAISVLTERDHFGGRPEDLVRAKRATCLPVLRKDFIVDEYQVYESRALGADGVLLIARLLGGDGLRVMLAHVAGAGLEALVEVHTEDELHDALDADAAIIGINNRDLATLEVDLAVVEQLRPLVPDGILVVSESGCRTRADVDRVRATGVDAVLVGGALMAADDTMTAMRGLFGKE